MTEITIHLQTEKTTIHPEFLHNLKELTNEYGLQIKKSLDYSEEKPLNHEQQQQLLDTFIQEADKLAEGMPTQTVASTDIIREDRNQ